MKKIMKRLFTLFMGLVMLIGLLPISVLALSEQEQEDFYRVNTWWQDEYNQLYIDWILESDNFMYHLDISQGNIIHDVSYAGLNLDPKQRKDNFVEILASFIGLSYDQIREQSAAEAFSQISTQFLNGFKSYLKETQLYTVDQFKYVEKAINETSDFYLNYYYGINTDMGEYGYQAIYERIESAFDTNVQDFDWSDHKDQTLEEFYNFVSSHEWHSKLSKISGIFSTVGESVELAEEGFALIGELESFKQTDEKLVELLRYVRAKTTDSALKYACDEIIAKFGNSYETNIIQGILQIAADKTLKWTFDNVKDLIYSNCGISGVFAKIGITVGNVVSDMWFNTTETKQQMQTIYCLEEISELLVSLLKTELPELYLYEEPSDFRAEYAADAIYHMRVLIELRRKGEESYYKLKDSVYSSNIINACKTFAWGSFADDEQVIEAWYSEFTKVINGVEGSLYKMIPAYYFYKLPEPETFEHEGTRLVSYNGNSIDVYIPATDDYATIDSYAFNANDTIETVNIPHTIKTINSNAFYDCTNIIRITINSPDATIAEEAFVNCSEDLTIYGYSNSAAHEYAIANDINFESFDNEYENTQDYVDSDFIIADGVLVEYVGDGGDVYIPYGVTEIGISAFQDCDSLTSIDIPDSVTVISISAFQDCDSLTSIDIPDSVTVIGISAFLDCDSLTSIDIPDSVTVIGVSAFQDCDSLTSIDIPDSVTDIGGSAFRDCDSLTSIDIPDSVTYIGGYAFQDCDSLTSIDIPDSVTYIGGEAFRDCDSLTSITIPNGVTEISDHAFDSCNNLTSVTIPDSVTSIGDYAFRNCFRLTSITIPEDVEYIGDSAFENSNCFTDLTLPNCVTQIGDLAFAFCYNLTSVTIPNSVYYIGDSAFAYCENLTSVTIFDGITHIGSDTFTGCHRLTKIAIPDSVTEISDDAFGFINYCQFTIICGVGSYAESYAKENNISFVYDNVKYISVSCLPNQLVYLINEELIADGLCLDVILDDGRQFAVTMGYTIGDYDFSTIGTKTITVTYGGLTVDFEVTVICNHVFGEWTTITASTCTTPGEEYCICSLCGYEETQIIDAFGHDYAENWTIDEYETCTTVGSKSHHCLNCDEKIDVTEIPAAHTWSDEWTIDVQETCTTVGSKSHHCLNCDEKTDVTEIPAAHTWSDEWTIDVLETCTTVGSKSRHCLNCDEKTDVTEIPASHTWSDEWTVDVEPTETTEGSRSRHCALCDARTDITVIPSLRAESPATDFDYSIIDGKVTINGYIGISQTMNIPSHIDGYPVTTISAFAFYDNSIITKATIPYTVKNIEYYAFCDCSNLSEITIFSRITEIPQSAFSGCGNLTSVILPETITSIGDGAFYNCSSLVSIDLGEKVVSIGDDAFRNCTALKEINIPDTTSAIGGDAFYDTPWFDGLSGDCVIMGNGILMRYQNEFGEDIRIPEGVRAVYGDFTGGAFEESYVGTVYIPSTLYSWEQALISIDAESFVVNEDNPYLYSLDDVLYSFDKTIVKAVPSLKTGTYTLPETVRYIEASAFESSLLEKVVLNDGLLEIGDDAFYFADIELNIPNTVIAIGKNAFCYNTALTEITIPSGVQHIEGWTFSGCSSLERIVLPEDLTQIDSYAFYRCDALSTVVYCGKTKQWEEVEANSNGNIAFLSANVICLGDIKFSGASLTLHHNIAINYKVEKTLFEEMGYEDPYVIFEMNGVKTKVSNYSISEDNYVFTFRNIAPHQMNDTIQSTIYASYNGVEYEGESREYSVAEYCYSMLDLYSSDQYAELRTLLVDLLHYGAASQTYTNYRTDALVNSLLTATQLEWGTSEEPNLDTVLDTTYKTVENPIAKWKGAGLNLKESVSIRMKFTSDYAEDLTVKVESEDRTWTISSDKFVEEDGVYYVYITGLGAGQMRQSVYLTLCNGDTAVSNTVCYSIGSYAYEKQSSTISGLSDLVIAMMKYGDSAYEYVN